MSGGRPRKRSLPIWTFLILVVVGLLVLEDLGLAAVSSRPPLQVEESSWIAGNGTVFVDFALRAGALPVSAHIGLAPGSIHGWSDPTVLYFVDPQFRPFYASSGDIQGIGMRISSYLGTMGSSDRLVYVDAATVGPALAEHPHAALVFLGTGVLPDQLYSANSSLLRTWLSGGGTLIWAGGPLAYSSGHPSSAGFVYDSLLWSGQTDLAGFSVTDPFSTTSPTPPPGRQLFSDQASAVGAALGFGYRGTATGANTSEVASHRGVSLGTVTPSLPPGGPAPITSLAYFPVGAGSIFFFGGALYAAPFGYIPDASVTLSLDIATILALELHPYAGPAASSAASLPAFGSMTIGLSVPGAPGGLIGVASSGVQGALSGYWDEQIIQPSPVVPLETDGLGP